MYKRIIALALILLLGLSACVAREGVAVHAPAAVRITAEQAMEMMGEGGDVVILDVRSLSEFNSGHIENAVLLPVDEIEGRIADIVPDKNQVLLVYCAAGVRSARAAALLAEMGYENAYDFGGIRDWRGEIIMP